MREIGFMQGRLVDQIDGKIQAFPWDEWRVEFPRARQLGLTLIEWTLDDERMDANPFVDPACWEEVKRLSEDSGVKVRSLTGDCFMQAPFWKADGQERADRLAKLDRILAAAAALRTRYVVVPLVDAGRLESDGQQKLLLAELMPRHEFLVANSLQIIFETDYAPKRYREFIDCLPEDAFNVNYDTGNSASLGFDPQEEFECYGERIVNVHVKDRILGGTTVPLGTGNADFKAVFNGLADLGYAGDFILQTARAKDRNHSEVLAGYLRMTRQWIVESYGP
jgi:hexulose-6-phosphate isomerase